MKFEVDQKIYRKFPGTKIGVMLGFGVKNRVEGRGERGEDEIPASPAGRQNLSLAGRRAKSQIQKSGYDEIEQLLKSWEDRQRINFEEMDFEGHARIEPWREVFREFGAKPSKYKSSVESLISRVVREGGVPRVNPLVDLGNALSLKYLLPVGADDLDKVEGKIRLAFAQGGEPGRYLGSRMVVSCKEGEVAYLDEIGFLCRRWNWREAERTKITNDSENVILVVEALEEVEKEEVERLMEEFVEMAEKMVGGEWEVHMLKRSKNSVVKHFSTGSKLTKEERGLEVEEKEEILRPSGSTQGSRSAQDDKSGIKSFPDLSNKTGVVGQVRGMVARAVDLMGFDVEGVEVERPADVRNGDLSSNVAMGIYSEYKKTGKEIAYKNPKELAEGIIAIIEKDQPEFVERMEVAGPGFVNFYFTNRFLTSRLLEVVNQQQTTSNKEQALENNKQSTESSQMRSYGFSKVGKGKKIIVEHTQPNTNKPNHIGHLRNSVLGMSLVHVLRAVGYEVVSTNINNDRGIANIKGMWAYLAYGKEVTQTQIETAQKILPTEKFGWRERLDEWMGSRDVWKKPEEYEYKPDKWIGQFYVMGSNAYEEFKWVKRDMQEMLVAWEDGDEKVRELWKQLNEWFYQGSWMTLDRLGVVLDTQEYESELYWKGKEIVEQAVEQGKDGFVRLEDGAVQARLEKHGLPNKILVRSDGTAIYMTFDIELTRKREQEMGMDKCYWVVGSDQELHFQQLFAVCEMLGFGDKSRWEHFSYGMVELPEGKMSSRKGQVVTADAVIEAAVEKAGKVIEKAQVGADLSQEERTEVVEKVGIGAVKYGILAYAPKSKVKFDVNRAVSFEGNSGPYVQYTYARARSVLRKYQVSNKQQVTSDNLQDGGASGGFGERGQTPRDRVANGQDLPGWMRVGDGLEEVVGLLRRMSGGELEIDMSTEERDVLGHLERFPELVLRVAKEMAPHLLAEYVYELARKFNKFYEKRSILGENANEETRWFRVGLTAGVAEVLRTGLGMLGIEVVERM